MRLLASTHTLRQSLVRLAAVAFLATLSLAPVAVEAQSSDDLATALSKQKNVTTYTSLLSKYPAVFAKLPSSGATILVPTDAAFVKFPIWDRGNAEYAASLVSYHILGGKVSIGGIALGASQFAHSGLVDPKYSNVTGGAVVMITKQPGSGSDVVVFTSGMATRATLVGAPDIAFAGGSLQLIDSILTEPARLEQTALEAYRDLTSFLAAGYAANVVGALADTPNVTIFAPRNAAMQLVAGALQGLSAAQLARVMQFHVVPGRVMHSAELKQDAEFVSAVSGAPALHVTRFNNDIFLNSARVIQTDILVANGVVHMLEDVLNPDAGDLRPDTALETQKPAFSVGASASPTGTGAPLPFTTALPCTSGCATGAGGSGNGTHPKTSTSEGFAAGVYAPMPTAMALGLAGLGAVGAGLL